MMKTAHEIIKVQDELKKMYSNEEYYQVVNKLKEKTGDNIEILSALAHDQNMSADVRLFAIATMGE